MLTETDMADEDARWSAKAIALYGGVLLTGGTIALLRLLLDGVGLLAVAVIVGLIGGAGVMTLLGRLERRRAKQAWPLQRHDGSA
ncbi:MAG: hypothetical protein Q7V57_12055 [Actinomycetota bacterium]|nr:hypothetical protein [Actinomycetota bacterium]